MCIRDRVDPDDLAGVEYGTTAKAQPRGTAKKTGTDALKININTPAGGSTTGGMNV